MSFGQTKLEAYRSTLLSEQDKITQLITEICLFDSVHDFDSSFYDKIPKSKLIESSIYGDIQPSLLSNINFTFVNSIINPRSNLDLHRYNQDNNKVAGGALGVIPADYTKSKSLTKDNIEKYYFLEVLKTLGHPCLDASNNIKEEFIIKNNVSEEDAYGKLLTNFENYAQFEETNGEKYIPVVIDVQKRLLKVLRSQSTTGAGPIKIAYCLNREMTNDAAGKLNYREPVKVKGLHFFVDIDTKNIEYEDSNKIFIGYNKAIFSEIYNMGIDTLKDIRYQIQDKNMPDGMKITMIRNPYCNVKFEPSNSYNSYNSILNDSLNSKSGTQKGINKAARYNLAKCIQLQNSKINLDLKEYLSKDKFGENYKENIIPKILEVINDEDVLKDYAEEIYFYFMRKRLGDQLQALSCLKKRKYSKVFYTSSNQLKMTNAIEQTLPAVFCSYDVIACAFAIANNIPCIYEDSKKNMYMILPKNTTNPQLNLFGGYLMDGGAKLGELSRSQIKILLEHTGTEDFNKLNEIRLEEFKKMYLELGSPGELKGNKRHKHTYALPIANHLLQSAGLSRGAPAGAASARGSSARGSSARGASARLASATKIAPARGASASGASARASTRQSETRTAPARPLINNDIIKRRSRRLDTEYSQDSFAQDIFELILSNPKILINICSRITPEQFSISKSSITLAKETLISLTENTNPEMSSNMLGRIVSLMMQGLKYASGYNCIAHPYVISEEDEDIANLDFINVFTKEENITDESFNPLRLHERRMENHFVLVDIDELKIVVDIKLKNIYFENNPTSLIGIQNVIGIFDALNGSIEEDRIILEFILEHTDDIEIYNNYVGQLVSEQGGGSNSNMSPNSVVLGKSMSIHMLKKMIMDTSLFYEGDIYLNMLNKFMFLKLLSTYEYKLIFDEELYEMYYDLSEFPHIASNLELYCLFETLKHRNDINIFHLFAYLQNIKESSNFARDLVYFLGDISDFVLEKYDHELISLFENSRIMSRNISQYEVIVSEAQALFESMDKGVQSRFTSHYFFELLESEKKEIYRNMQTTKSLPNENQVKPVKSIKQVKDKGVYNSDEGFGNSIENIAENIVLPQNYKSLRSKKKKKGSNSGYNSNNNSINSRNIRSKKRSKKSISVGGFRRKRNKKSKKKKKKEVNDIINIF